MYPYSLTQHRLCNPKKMPFRTSLSEDLISSTRPNSVALAGGPNYAVPTGRRDGLASNPNLVNFPGPSISISQALKFFTTKKLSLKDMVTLLGAHTIGVAHCGFFQDRLSNFQGSGKLDPTAFLDQNTSFVFDNEYYHQIKLKRGVMQIDQELALDKGSAPIVTGFASNAIGFQQGFAKAIVKMGGIEVLVGNARKLEKILGLKRETTKLSMNSESKIQIKLIYKNLVSSSYSGIGSVVGWGRGKEEEFLVWNLEFRRALLAWEEEETTFRGHRPLFPFGDQFSIFEASAVRLSSGPLNFLRLARFGLFDDSSVLHCTPARLDTGP
ncbi:hypothetical protein HYC85_025511 [Camellia sinensis]|uniref:Peroxidase n=1 Tax=Camellia sinensis TaxID=4442 RepID=A0A7J7GCI7_CAMSI|nr:hypothetical protein HYC85_025511 [Camellia sinensis]